MRFIKSSQSTIIAGCAAAFLCAIPLLATQPQSSATAASKPEAKTADRLMLEVKTDAQIIEAHAARLERLTKDSDAKWAEFDEQWNEIKPAQEALQMKMRRLESMRASLSDQQRKALDDSKSAVQTISARTEDLVRLIEKSGADLKSPNFRSDAQSLAMNAETVARLS